MSNVSFDQLVTAVQETARADDPIARLEAAMTISGVLSNTADALLDHFVERCRDAGRSWAEIGTVLGVTRQGAQQRFVDGSLSRMTARTRHVVEVAREIADDQGAAEVRLDHLLLALWSEPAAIGPRVLTGIGVTEAALAQAVSSRTSARGAKLSEQSPADQAVLATAIDLGHNYVGTEHILLACYRQPKSAVALALSDVGASASVATPAVMAAIAAATN